jgi:hypothetical protein
MAKTVDDLQINVTVQGTAQIQETVTHTDNLDASTKRVSDTMRNSGQNIRNVAYQIQDLSVQIAGGTSAFVALGQQVPQLLGSFGTMGIVIGAVAAITIPLLQAGLKIVGIDMRSLKERTDDLTSSVKALKEAQQQNLPTLEGLRGSYGSLSEEAKRFFEINEQLKQQKVYSDLSTSISQLKKDFGFMNNEIDLTTKSSQAMGEAMMGAAINNAWLSVKAYMLGLTAEQAREVAKQIKNIDASNPEKAASTINNILEYLKTLGPEADNFRRKFEETYVPMIKMNEALIEQKRNIKAAAEEATRLSASLMNKQAGTITNAGEARRNFDQITAIGIESAAKIREFNIQAQEKTSKDQVNRSGEMAAFANKTNAERINAEKDFYKAQNETFYGQQLSNEKRERSLDLERKVNDLKLGQTESLNYQSILEENSLRNIHEQVEANLAIEELYRKNLITRQRANQLEEQAAGIRRQADKTTEQQIAKTKSENERSIRVQVENMILANSERTRSFELEKQIAGMSTNAQNYKRKELELENSRLRTINDIRNNARLSDAEKLDAIQRINQEYDYGLNLARQELEYRKQMDNDIVAGAADRIKSIRESFTAFKVGGQMIDSVFNNMNSAIDNFVDKGKFSFSDFANSVIRDLIRIQMKQAATNILSQTLGFLGLSGRAGGGPVDSGSPYIVGENGPELFIPKSAGDIIPNNMMGNGTPAGGTYVNYTINAVDSLSFKQMLAKDPTFLYALTEQGKKSVPSTRR